MKPWGTGSLACHLTFPNRIGNVTNGTLPYAGPFAVRQHHNSNRHEHLLTTTSTSALLLIGVSHRGGARQFAKGPVYFLSASLAARLVSSEVEAARAAALEAAARRVPVFEDVWVGYALSTQLTPPPNLTIVQVTGGLYNEPTGFYATNSTSAHAAATEIATIDGARAIPTMCAHQTCSQSLPSFPFVYAVIWHAKVHGIHREYRLPIVHRWFEKYHCSLMGPDKRPRRQPVILDWCGKRPREGASCTGGKWWWCEESMHNLDCLGKPNRAYNLNHPAWAELRSSVNATRQPWLD
eukprot:7380013-Prymnesium_polylepis.3